MFCSKHLLDHSVVIDDQMDSVLVDPNMKDVKHGIQGTVFVQITAEMFVDEEKDQNASLDYQTLLDCVHCPSLLPLVRPL